MLKSSCEKLTEIVISNSVTVVEQYAFDSCKVLSAVYYTGTADEWASITVNSNNASLASASVYFYSETTPTEEGNFWHYDDNGQVAVW